MQHQAPRTACIDCCCAPGVCTLCLQEHDDDIRCLAMHPSRSLVATGQVASALDGTADGPFVCIWDPTTTPPKQVARLDFPSEGGASSRFIVAVGFSPCGERLAVVTGDNRHTTYVYDWRKGTVLCQGVGHNGQPPQVSHLLGCLTPSAPEAMSYGFCV